MKTLKEEEKQVTKNLIKMINDLTYSEDDADWIKGALEVLRDE